MLSVFIFPDLFVYLLIFFSALYFSVLFSLVSSVFLFLVSKLSVKTKQLMVLCMLAIMHFYVAMLPHAAPMKSCMILDFCCIVSI